MGLSNRQKALHVRFAFGFKATGFERRTDLTTHTGPHPPLLPVEKRTGEAGERRRGETAVRAREERGWVWIHLEVESVGLGDGRKQWGLPSFWI